MDDFSMKRNMDSITALMVEASELGGLECLVTEPVTESFNPHCVS